MLTVLSFVLCVPGTPTESSLPTSATPSIQATHRTAAGTTESFAETNDPPATSTSVAPPVASEDASTKTTPASVDADNSLLIGGASLAIMGAMLAGGAVAWWVDKGLEPFHLKETGYLGRDTYAGGADKMGHFTANFIAVQTMTSVYEWLGVEHDHALLFASAFILTAGTAIEVIDGFTRHGFEYQDVIANALGLGLGVLSVVSPEFASVFGVRISYFPSPTYKAALNNGLRAYINTINDYSGEIVYLDLKLKGVFELLGLRPGPARYLLAGVNWGTYGYEPDAPMRARHLGFHASIAMNEVIDQLGWGRPGRRQARFSNTMLYPSSQHPSHAT